MRSPKKRAAPTVLAPTKKRPPVAPTSRSPTREKLIAALKKLHPMD